MKSLTSTSFILLLHSSHVESPWGIKPDLTSTAFITWNFWKQEWLLEDVRIHSFPNLRGRHFKEKAPSSHGSSTAILYTILLTVCPREEVCQAALAADREWGQKRAHTEIWRSGNRGGLRVARPWVLQQGLCHTSALQGECAMSQKISLVTLLGSHLMLLCFYLFRSC